MNMVLSEQSGPVDPPRRPFRFVRRSGASCDRPGTTWRSLTRAFLIASVVMSACTASDRTRPRSTVTTEGTSPGGSVQAPTRMRLGVLVTDGGPRVVTPGWPAGLWLVTASGRVQHIADRRWSIVAASPQGLVVAQHAAADRERGYVLLRPDGATTLSSSSAPVPCASWSGDGRRIAFLTGRTTVYERFPKEDPAFRD